jgi:hypothetical protein
MTALGIRLFFKRGKHTGTAAFIAAGTAFVYAALITVPWLAIIIPEWIGRILSI